MKTSILISSIAALYLLGAFATAPRRHGEDKSNFTSADNITIVSPLTPTMLPGVVITADRKKAAGTIGREIPAADMSYLEFHPGEYAVTDAVNPEDLPETAETDYSYLKFNLNDYMTDSELTGDEISELPLTGNVDAVSAAGPAVNEFECLRFNVRDYLDDEYTDAAGIGELSLGEAKTALRSEQAVPLEPLNEFGYLKFYVADYYRTADPGAGEQFELPEE